MKRTNISALPALLAAACVVCAMPAGAEVTVKFIQPDNYADMPFTPDGKDRVMDDLKRHFIKLGSTLPAGQDLRIEVTDVDLAGRMEPTSRAAPDFRILRGGADWPIISLRFAVEANGQVIKRGDERIADMSYLQQINPYTASESLRYEKLMLDRWFKNVVLSKAP